VRKHARALQADLLTLQVTYGRDAVSQAMTLSQQRERIAHAAERLAVGDNSSMISSARARAYA
jgi:hypothetical protein